MLVKRYILFYFMFISFTFSADKLYEIKRFFLSCGLILEPTVLINQGQLYENDNSSVLGGFKIGIDSFTSIFNKKRVGFIGKSKLFFVKLREMDLYRKPKLKNDFKDFIFGIQIEVGMSIVLNKYFDKIAFDENNNINSHVNSLNFLFGFKEEIGKFSELLKAEKIFPTKLVCEMIYILDIKQGFSFYIGVSFYQCFSFIYLFSCNKNDFFNIFNNNNYFNWNISIELGFFGLNFFI